MELFVVILAVGASAYFTARHLWRSFSRPMESGCGEGCAGCTCASGHTNKDTGHDFMPPDQIPQQDCKLNR